MYATRLLTNYLLLTTSSFPVHPQPLRNTCSNFNRSMMKQAAVGNSQRRKRRSGLRISTMDEFFPTSDDNTTNKKLCRTSLSTRKESAQRGAGKGTNHATTRNELAEKWGACLTQSPTYLTEDGKSWYILAKKWLPSPSPVKFEQEWNLHPEQRHSLNLFGRTVQEKRWSSSWGVAYAYSGSTNQGRPIEKGSMVPHLLEKANELAANVSDSKENNGKPYNGCLQNWYTPDDRIGLHSDDEKSMRQEYPILSLTWGGTRRFLLRRKEKKNDIVELYLEDGDLLLMGGTCQETHKHEVPKRRVTKDPETSNRINWTIRAFAVANH